MGKKIRVEVINKKAGGTIILTSYTTKDGKHFDLRDAEGNPRLIRLNSVRYLDLDNPLDKQEYEAWLHHPVYVAGPNPLVRLVDEEKEAEQTIEEAVTLVKLLNIALKLSDKEAQALARMLGKGTDSPPIARAHIIEKIVDNTKDMERLFKDPDIRLRLLMYMALKEGKIIRKSTGEWFYGKQVIGTNEMSALAWLKENKDVVAYLEKELDYSVAKTETKTEKGK